MKCLLGNNMVFWSYEEKWNLVIFKDSVNSPYNYSYVKDFTNLPMNTKDFNNFLNK